MFDQVEAYTTGAVTMLGGAKPIEVRVASISDGLFGLLGLPVVLGRGFRAEENVPGRNDRAILDYGFWQRAFGGDSRVIGRGISVGGISYAIVGVPARRVGCRPTCRARASPARRTCICRLNTATPY